MKADTSPTMLPLHHVADGVTTITKDDSATETTTTTGARPCSPLRQRKLFPGTVPAEIPAAQVRPSRQRRQQEQPPQHHRQRFPRLLQNATARARILKVAVGLYFVLCVTMSGLVFTWTMASTFDQNTQSSSITNNNVRGDGRILLRNPLSRLRTGWARQGGRLLEEPPLQEPHTQELSQQQEENAVANNEVVVKESPTNDLPESLRIPDEEPVVQIINTRFMQHQPDLMELGLARLELLKTICLPTLQQQTSKNFLWIIRADPALAEPLKRQLLRVVDRAMAVSPHFRVVVLGSNDNPNGIRRRDWPDETAAQVWTQSGWALLQHFQQAAQSRVVLETRLDADDGLHISFVEKMQQEAKQYLVEDAPTDSLSFKKSNDNESNDNNSNHRNWLIWCAGTHVEWQYGAPWEFLAAQDNSTKTASQAQKSDSDSSLGSLMPGLTKGCITPGLTKGYGKHVDYDDVPDAQHHMLHKKVRACKAHHSKDHSKGRSHPPLHHHCLVMWKELIPAAVRGRTPTSAGMQFVVGKHMSSLSPAARQALGADHPEDLRDKQHMMWDSVEHRFEITRDSVRDMRTFLTDHMHGIIQDNYDGQCTQGHSCKNSSRIILKQLMEE